MGGPALPSSLLRPFSHGPFRLHVMCDLPPSEVHVFHVIPFALRLSRVGGRRMELETDPFDVEIFLQLLELRQLDVDGMLSDVSPSKK